MASRPLDRLCGLIGGALDGHLGRLSSGGALVWLPAHRTRAAVGVATLSDGRVMSWTDWRANRLVDALAKSAARMRPMPPRVGTLLASASAAAQHAAALLGAVTHAANHHVVQVPDSTGKLVERVCRDAEPRPPGPRPSRKRPAPGARGAPLQGSAGVPGQGKR